MNRREFARTVAGTAIETALPARHLYSRSSDAAPAIKLSVMMWTVFRDSPFEDRLERIAAAGYRAVELVDEFEKWSDGDYRRFNARKRSLGLTFDATAGVSKGIADPGGGDAFLSELKTFLAVAEKLECPRVIILSGDRIGGLAHRVQHETCVETLKRAAEVAFRQNVTLLLENIDPEESPEYFLTSAAEGLEIVRKVDHPHIKFLYDFYHEQIAEGNLIEKLEKNIDYVGLVHIADVPGRHQPGTGEINYENIFRKLAELKFTNYAAMEFEPVGDPDSALRSAREMAVRSTL